MALTKREIQMMEHFASKYGEQLSGSLDEISETLKKLEPLVSKHEFILGEDERSGLRGTVATQNECLRGLENFETEIKAKAGVVAVLISLIVSAVAWLANFLSTHKV